MEVFRTTFDISDADCKIDYNSQICFIGSCFSDNIGNKLASLKFTVDINPFGVLYNPISIANSIDILISNKIFTEKDLQFHNNRWFSFFHHTSFSHSNKNECLKSINEKVNAAHYKLKNADYLFVTLGTARVYSFNKTKQIVSNCHKLPANEFTRELIEVNDIVAALEESLTKLLQFNSKIKVVFTVSPIRHWKDGATGNMLSKSTLFLAIDKLLKQTKNASYFPSYELMMDDLRDYRFYSDDMIHLSTAAVEYIFDKFNDVYIDESTRNLKKRIYKIVSASNHRPFDAKSIEFIKFATKNIEEITLLMEQYPHLDFDSELEYFQSLVNKK